MDPAWDVDYVVLQAVRGVAYRFEASVGPESLLDLYAEMEDPLGSTYSIDSGSSGDSEIYAFVAEVSGPYVFGIEARSGETGPYTVKVSPIPRDPYEPDDTPEDASAIALDGTIQQRDLVPSGDVDFVKFPVVEGRIYAIEASPNVGSESDIEIQVVDHGYPVDTWGPGLPERLLYEADATETLYVRIRDPRDQSWDGAPEGDYRLSVAEHVKLTVSTESIDFGAIALGSSAVKTVRITNPGPRAESMSLGLAGWNTAEYQLLDSYASVPAGGYRDVRIRYAPTTSNTGATRFVEAGGAWSDLVWYGGYHGNPGDPFGVTIMTYGHNVGSTGQFDWGSEVSGHEITGRSTAAAGDIYGVLAFFEGAIMPGTDIAYTATLTGGYAHSVSVEDGVYTGHHQAFVLRSGDCQLRAVQPDIEATAKVDVYGTVPGSTPLDTTPPVTTAGGYDAAWHNSAVTVTLSAVDNPGGSGVAKTEYKLDASSWTTGTSVTVPAPGDHSRDGLHTVSYRSTDVAGNVEAAKSCQVKIDTTAPAGSFLINNGAATTSTAAVTLSSSVSDANPPLQMRFRDAGGSWTAWEAYAAAKAWTLPAGDGIKTVEAEYRDPAGNVRALSDSIDLQTSVVDTTPPAVTAGGYDAAWHNHPVSLTLTASDAESGVRCIWWSRNDDPSRYQLLGYSGQLTVKAPADHSWDGDNAILYYGEDNAGNYPDPVTTHCHVKIDTRKPTTKAPYAASVVRYRTATLRYKVVDARPGSPTASGTIKVKNRAGKVVKTLTFTAKPVNTLLRGRFTVPRTWRVGTYRFYVYAKDAAGNAQASVGSNRLIVK